MPLRSGCYPSLLPVAAARLGGEESSMRQPPCRTPIMANIIQPKHIFQPVVGTHSCDVNEITRRVNPQHLDCNTATLMFTLIDVGIPAAVQRGARSIITKRDF